jgi:hypothetical protein
MLASAARASTRSRSRGKAWASVSLMPPEMQEWADGYDGCAGVQRSRSNAGFGNVQKAVPRETPPGIGGDDRYAEDTRAPGRREHVRRGCARRADAGGELASPRLEGYGGEQTQRDRVG